MATFNHVLTSICIYFFDISLEQIPQNRIDVNFTSSVPPVGSRHFVGPSDIRENVCCPIASPAVEKEALWYFYQFDSYKILFPHTYIMTKVHHLSSSCPVLNIYLHLFYLRTAGISSNYISGRSISVFTFQCEHPYEVTGGCRHTCQGCLFLVSCSTSRAAGAETEGALWEDNIWLVHTVGSLLRVHSL